MKAILGDCFDAMASLPDASIDMVLCDLPYGTTQNKWDSVLPLDKLWAEYWRVTKPNAAIVLTAQCPFDKMLGASQLRFLKYEWVWEKSAATGHLNAKKQPMKAHEIALVFYREQCLYYPQMESGAAYSQKSGRGSSNYRAQKQVVTDNTGERYPRSVLKFSHDKHGRFHPTQKPVALFEYLIRTYTQEGMTVLDNTAGSGTTGVAAHRSGRDAIVIERDPEYFDKMVARLIAEGVDLDVEIA